MFHFPHEFLLLYPFLSVSFIYLPQFPNGILLKSSQQVFQIFKTSITLESIVTCLLYCLAGLGGGGYVTTKSQLFHLSMTQCLSPRILPPCILAFHHKIQLCMFECVDQSYFCKEHLPFLVFLIISCIFVLGTILYFYGMQMLDLYRALRCLSSFIFFRSFLLLRPFFLPF